MKRLFSINSYDIRLKFILISLYTYWHITYSLPELRFGSSLSFSAELRLCSALAFSAELRLCSALAFSAELRLCSALAFSLRYATLRFASLRFASLRFASLRFASLRSRGLIKNVRFFLIFRDYNFWIELSLIYLCFSYSGTFGDFNVKTFALQTITNFCTGISIDGKSSLNAS